jgi:two-component system chemotaxis sensor kinase CheA
MATAPETIRVSVDLIDSMMNLAGELVLGRNQLRQELEDVAYQNRKLGRLIQSVDVVTSEIQEDIMQMRMQPVGNLLNKFTRVVRDLSRQLGKEVSMVIEGKEVELDKSILEGLSDPLTHLIRNSLDHGIEKPEERERLGKPRSGKLHVRTFHEGGQVNIMVIDDGGGIDPEKIVLNVVAKGFVTEEATAVMTDVEKINYILMPGMSTAETVTDVSGRGVGMDVVKTNIESMGGHLEIESSVNKGTTVRIRLPLTLAIIPSLIVGTSGNRFAIPQVNVKELFLIRAGEISNRIEKVGEAEVVRLRERLLPIVRLADVLGLERQVSLPETEGVIVDRRDKLSDRRQQDRNLKSKEEPPLSKAG